jgi:hypothetical protein
MLPRQGAVPLPGMLYEACFRDHSRCFIPADHALLWYAERSGFRRLRSHKDKYETARSTYPPSQSPLISTPEFMALKHVMAAETKSFGSTPRRLAGRLVR